MTSAVCPSCRDRGVFRVSYHDGAETDYALCLCRQGRVLRSDRNAGRRTGYPLYLLLAARMGVEPERFQPAEALLEDDELAARFGGVVPVLTPAIDLAAVGRQAPKAKL